MRLDPKKVFFFFWTSFSTVKYIRTLSKSLRRGISIDQLFFQLNNFHDDFQQILNGTNLFTIYTIKAESILYRRVE